MRHDGELRIIVSRGSDCQTAFARGGDGGFLKLGKILIFLLNISLCQKWKYYYLKRNSTIFWRQDKLGKISRFLIAKKSGDGALYYFLTNYKTAETKTCHLGFMNFPFQSHQALHSREVFLLKAVLNPPFIIIYYFIFFFAVVLN